MPRINIEEKWWSDPRRAMLICKLGFKEADGAMLNAIKISQSFNGEEFDATQLLPMEWIEALLSVGLANGSANAFYVKGAKEHHDWIKSQRERGKRGGQATKNKINNLDKATAKQRLSNGLANAGPSSSSSNNKNKKINKKENFVSWDEIKPQVFEQAKKLHGFDDAFCERVWAKLLAYDRDKPYKRRTSAAANWFNSSYTLSDWENFKESEKSKLPLAERYRQFFDLPEGEPQ